MTTDRFRLADQPSTEADSGAKPLEWRDREAPPRKGGRLLIIDDERMRSLRKAGSVL